jgi:CheY-like chemotaxis protein
MVETDGEHSRTGASILLVMEDLFFRKLLRRQLEAAGYAVDEALSVERAVVRMEARAPDLVLLDTWIDRGHGIKLLEFLRASDVHRRRPVLLIGNDGRDLIRRRASDLGAFGPAPLNPAISLELWVEVALAGEA